MRSAHPYPVGPVPLRSVFNQLYVANLALKTRRLHVNVKDDEFAGCAIPSSSVNSDDGEASAVVGDQLTPTLNCFVRWITASLALGQCT
jgi:hypothetical protein